jgi:DNA-binding response OmpR family regulator
MAHIEYLATRGPEGVKNGRLMQPIRVLVVDDEQDFASAIVVQLNRRGFRAAAVFSGQEAVESVRTTEYDALVLDLKMPGMDGLETLSAVRQQDPHLEVVVLTGHGSVSAGIGGMQLGAADFLQKPVALNTLCTAIEVAAERSRCARSAHAEL